MHQPPLALPHLKTTWQKCHVTPVINNITTTTDINQPPSTSMRWMMVAAAAGARDVSRLDPKVCFLFLNIYLY
jgi:hypothetical protein